MSDNKRLKRMIRGKLRSRAGESIAETLVALLISALALVMLAGVISASTRIVTSSREKLNKYYSVNEGIVKGSESEADAALNEDKSEGDEAEHVGSNALITLNRISSGGGATPAAAVNVRAYTNPVFSGKKVVSYRAVN